MTDSAQIPLAQFSVRRSGVNDTATLFADRIDVRWQRYTESGEATVPLERMSPHFQRSLRRGASFKVGAWWAPLCLILATAGALTLPSGLNVLISIYLGLCGAVLAIYAIYDFCVTVTQWTFMNVQHTAPIYVLLARPNDITAAESFVAKLVDQIQTPRANNSTPEPLVPSPQPQ